MKYMNRTKECLEIVVIYMDKHGPSPCHTDDMDDYLDEVLETGVNAYGPLNASQKSALAKFARDDWSRYHNVKGE